MTHASSSVADVIARMRTVVQPLSASDGVSCFVRLYLAVTEGVAKKLPGLTFRDPVFFARLDVVFADLFFSALDTYRADPGRTSRAWAPLFDLRSKPGIAPLQFALAGMNAHINHDLPVALVATCRELGVPLADGSPQHVDFVHVNGLLAVVEHAVKQQYLTGWLRKLDRAVHRVNRLDDVVTMWNVSRARDAAWANAEALWAIRDDAEVTARYLAMLDRSVGFAGRGLLVPADTWLQRLARRL